MPTWQVHEFLDWDRPFPRHAIPTITASEKSAERFISPRRSGVVEGRRTVRGACRALKRQLYRQTLGKMYLDGAAGLHVYSDFEKSQIERLVKPRAPNFLEVTYGTSVTARELGPDRFPDDDRKNIVFWGRADYFYKGLDTILDAIARTKTAPASTAFRLWVIGPDYNKGYAKLQRQIERDGLADFVRVLAPGDYTPGTIGLLKSADFCIMASRWDGHARTLRECAVAGVPIISNRQTHFDRILQQFGNGVLFDDCGKLSNILSDLGSDATQAVCKTAHANADALTDYLSWDKCAQRFVASLANLKPAQ